MYELLPDAKLISEQKLALLGLKKL